MKTFKRREPDEAKKRGMALFQKMQAGLEKRTASLDKTRRKAEVIIGEIRARRTRFAVKKNRYSEILEK